MHLTGREVKQSHRKLEANADSNGASLHTVLLQTYGDYLVKVYGSLHPTYFHVVIEQRRIQFHQKDVQSKYKQDTT